MKIGDHVILKSGSPVMTVVDIASPLGANAGVFESSYVTCAWRDGDAVREDWFPRACLSRVEVKRA